MPFLNLCTFVGNAGGDAEARLTPAGKQVTNFSVAVHQGRDKKPMWVRCSAWGVLAERAQEIKRGDCVLVSGRIELYEFVDKEGKTKYNIEMFLTELCHFDGKKEEAPF